MIVGIVFVVFILTVILTWRFCNPASSLYILDHPNERSLHVQATPRSGGVAVVIGISVGALLVWLVHPSDPNWTLLLLAGLPVALVSFVDDRHGVRVAVRILCHIAAGCLLIGLGYVPEVLELPGLMWRLPAVVDMLAALLFIVWMINLYNFMDGMDGFAGGMTVIGFITYALLGLQADNLLFVLASCVVAASGAGFLLFNFPPARIFLGDTGSSTLGFLMAAFSLWASRDKVFPLWIAVVVFSPFIVDATVTLLRRLSQGDKVWIAHKTHYYQKLVQLGWGHRRTVLAEYGLMLWCSLSALVAMGVSTVIQLGLSVVLLLLYIVLILSIERLRQRHSILVP